MNIDYSWTQKLINFKPHTSGVGPKSDDPIVKEMDFSRLVSIIFHILEWYSCTNSNRICANVNYTINIKRHERIVRYRNLVFSTFLYFRRFYRNADTWVDTETVMHNAQNNNILRDVEKQNKPLRTQVGHTVENYKGAFSAFCPCRVVRFRGYVKCTHGSFQRRFPTFISRGLWYDQDPARLTTFLNSSSRNYTS